VAIKPLTGDDLEEFYALWSKVWETEDLLYSEVLCPHPDFRHDGASNSRYAPGKTEREFTGPICSPPFYIGLHAVCLLPLYASVAGLIKECDSCEEYYLSRTWPDRNLLCAYCAGDA
jgi:hypothetical protein